MRELVLVVHISLDGYVAGSKGELDGFPGGEENLQFVCDLTKNADAALFGRISYQMIDAYWPQAKDRPDATEGQIAYSEWYNAVKKIVVSRRLKNEDLKTNTVVIDKNIAQEVKKLKEHPGKNILLFGSPSVAQLLMEARLVDSYWIFVNPVIFGKGIRLFRQSDRKTALQLIDSKQFANGELALHYT